MTTPQFDIRNAAAAPSAPKIVVKDLNFHYGRNQALHNI
jgi:hypothetical protein